MLSITNLHATVGDKQILNGLTLEVPAGEVHAIMGPNGAGKSTLSYVLTGRPGYTVTEGSATLNGEDLLALEANERAAEGRVPVVPVSAGNSGGSGPDLHPHRAQRPAQGARRGRDRRPGLPQDGPRDGSLAEDRLRDAQARAQRRLLRRREEADGNLPDGDAGAALPASSTRPTAAWTSTPCGSCRRASTPCAAPTAACW